MEKEKILENVEKLMIMHKNGLLGGEIMPEDANPGFKKDSLNNYLCTDHVDDHTLIM